MLTHIRVAVAKGLNRANIRREYQPAWYIYVVASQMG